MRINTPRTLEDQIRKLKRDMSAILRKLNEMEEEIKGFRKETNECFEGVNKRFNGVDERFDGLKNQIASFEDKVGESFLALTGPLETHCESKGAEASRIIKENWGEKGNE